MEKKICPVCGAKIPSLAGYCPECGATLRKMEPTSNRKNDPLDVDDEDRGTHSRQSREDRYDREPRDSRRMRDEEEEESYEIRHRQNNSRRLLPLFIILCAVLIALIGLVAAQILRRSPGSETQAVPETTAAMTTAPAETQAETTLPETTAPETTLSETTAPETTLAETSAAESSESQITGEDGEEETAAGDDEEEEEEEETEAETTKHYSTEGATEMITTTAVNLRKGPGTDYDVIRTIPDDAFIKVIKTSGSWYLIDYHGEQGYISSKYALTEKELQKKESESASRKAEEESKKAETEKETTQSETKKGTDDSSILDSSSSSYLDKSDLKGLSKSELRKARNEIYARHGYIFTDSSLQKYFESKSWYSAKTSDASKIESKLNKYENANLKLIYDYEEEKGYR